MRLSYKIVCVQVAFSYLKNNNPIVEDIGGSQRVSPAFGYCRFRHCWCLSGAAYELNVYLL